MQKLLLLVVVLIISGCTTSINKFTTPNLKVLKDTSDGIVFIRQPPVNASRDSFESGDAWHTLGFEWFSKLPDTIFFTVGVVGQAGTIDDITLIADDQIIQNIKPASDSNLDIDKSAGIPLKDSSRRYTIPLEEFRKIAVARIVKMKLLHANNISLSQFGKDYPYVAVTGKFSPFLNKVDNLISRDAQDRKLAQ